MREIKVYAFEREGDTPATDWTTMDYTTAQQYAEQHGYSLIERTYEYADSELIEDYRPGHNLDGTRIECMCGGNIALAGHEPRHHPDCPLYGTGVEIEYEEAAQIAAGLLP